MATEYTKGPWEIASYYEAGVNDGTHPGWNPPNNIPHGQCAFCGNPEGKLIKEYKVNGGTTHLHRFPSSDWHDIYSVNGTKITGNYDYEEGGVCNSEADARLIAAAPDLYEALRRWMGYWHGVELAMDSSELEMYEATVAAISKAEGK